MIFPKLKDKEKSRSFIQEFGGYNSAVRIGEGEFSDLLNLSSKDYPVLSTREPRGRIAEVDAKYKVCGFAASNDLYAVVLYDESANSARLAFGNDTVNITTENIYTIGLDHNDDERKIVFFGAYICVFPDQCYINTFDPTKDCGKMRGAFCKFSAELTGSYYPESYESGGLRLGTAVLTEKEREEWEFKDKTEYYITIDERGNILKSDFFGVYLITCEHTEDREFILRSLRNMFGNVDYNNDFDETNKTFTVKARIPYVSIDTTGTERNFSVSHFAVSVSILDNTVYHRGKTIENVAKKLSNPFFDHVVECQNRLWGCLFGKNPNGDTVNAIYATALGTFDEWYTSDGGTAAAAYEVSVGSRGAFTAATVIGQNPVFFKEDVVHKVYVSATGAHQVVNTEIRGVDDGSTASLVHINEGIIYKSRGAVVVYSGSSVSSISSVLGDLSSYSVVAAGAARDKYVMLCRNPAEEAIIFSYDLNRGIWHKENLSCDVTVESTDKVFMAALDGKLIIAVKNKFYSYEHFGAEDKEGRISFMLESGDIGYSSPDKKYLTRLDLRISLGFGSLLRIWIQYDGDGAWINLHNAHGIDSEPAPIVLPVIPRRCDHFRIKLTGAGDFKLYGIAKEMTVI